MSSLGFLQLCHLRGKRCCSGAFRCVLALCVVLYCRSGSEKEGGRGGVVD